MEVSKAKTLRKCMKLKLEFVKGWGGGGGGGSFPWAYYFINITILCIINIVNLPECQTYHLHQLVYNVTVAP